MGGGEKKARVYGAFGVGKRPESNSGSSGDGTCSKANHSS